MWNGRRGDFGVISICIHSLLVFYLLCESILGCAAVDKLSQLTKLQTRPKSGGNQNAKEIATSTGSEPDCLLDSPWSPAHCLILGDDNGDSVLDGPSVQELPWKRQQKIPRAGVHRGKVVDCPFGCQSNRGL